MASRKPKPKKTSKPGARKRKLLWLAIAAPVVIVLVGGTATFAAFKLGLFSDSGFELPQHADPVAGPVTPAPRPTTIVSFAQGCATAECHAAFLAAPSLHQPVRLDACDQCHLPDEGGHVFPIARQGEDLCIACHEAPNHKLVQHNAVSAQGCTACHDPHRSEGPALLKANTVAATCAECHPSPSAGKVRHAPFAAGECVACHEPHESDFPNLLRGGVGMDHCAQCHAPLVEAVKDLRHTHSQIEGQCEACHDPHAADRPSLLTRDAGVDCLECHDDVRRIVETATVTHGAVMTGERCVSCHNPHAADIPYMLRDGQAAVCMECHDTEQQGNDGHAVPAMAAMLNARLVHGPIKMDQCSACHSVHGSTRASLLGELSPKVLFGKFDIRNYAMCFQCHDQELVLEETTTSATQFRNGSRNLHNVHIVQADQAASCTQCHAVHATDTPRLIAQKVSYQGSDWLMDMNFELRADGGSCGPGCHETLSYTRTPTALPELPGGEP